MGELQAPTDGGAWDPTKRIWPLGCPGRMEKSILQGKWPHNIQALQDQRLTIITITVIIYIKQH